MDFKKKAEETIAKILIRWKDEDREDIEKALKEAWNDGVEASANVSQSQCEISNECWPFIRELKEKP